MEVRALAIPGIRIRIPEIGARGVGGSFVGTQSRNRNLKIINYLHEEFTGYALSLSMMYDVYETAVSSHSGYCMLHSHHGRSVKDTDGG